MWQNPDTPGWAPQTPQTPLRCSGFVSGLSPGHPELLRDRGTPLQSWPALQPGHILHTAHPARWTGQSAVPGRVQGGGWRWGDSMAGCKEGHELKSGSMAPRGPGLLCSLHFKSFRWTSCPVEPFLHLDSVLDPCRGCQVLRKGGASKGTHTNSPWLKQKLLMKSLISWSRGAGAASAHLQCSVCGRMWGAGRSGHLLSSGGFRLVGCPPGRNLKRIFSECCNCHLICSV